ncbi:hypothetical protein B0H15DRAFT_1024298, partial [Mycena belliarum]
MLLRKIIHVLGTALLSGPALYTITLSGNQATLSKWREAAFDAFQRRYLPQPRHRRRRVSYNYNVTRRGCPNPAFDPVSYQLATMRSRAPGANPLASVIPS